MCGFEVNIQVLYPVSISRLKIPNSLFQDSSHCKGYDHFWQLSLFFLKIFFAKQILMHEIAVFWWQQSVYREPNVRW